MSAARRLSCRSQALGLSQFSFDEIGTVPFRRVPDSDSPSALYTGWVNGWQPRGRPPVPSGGKLYWQTRVPATPPSTPSAVATPKTRAVKTRGDRRPRRTQYFVFSSFQKSRGIEKPKKQVRTEPHAKTRRRRGRRRLPPANIEESRGSPRQSPPSPLGSRDFAVPLAHCRRRADNRPNKRYT